MRKLITELGWDRERGLRNGFAIHHWKLNTSPYLPSTFYEYGAQYLTYGVQCTPFDVHRTQYVCTAYSVRRTPYNICNTHARCSLYVARVILRYCKTYDNIRHFTHYSTHYTVYSVQYTLYSVHCTLYSVQYTLYSVNTKLLCLQSKYSPNNISF